MNGWYRLKRALLTPRVYYGRRRHADESPFMKAALELHYYRRPFYDYINAYAANPDILHEAPLDEHSVVLDVGAYDGQWSRRLFDRYRCRIIAFEPHPHSFQRLQTAAGGDWQCVACGLADATGTSRFHLKGMGSSAFPAPEASGEIIEVPMKAVEEAWLEFGLDEVALMKINIEGGEYPLLERMIDCDLLGRVGTCLVQFHEWLPGAYRRRRRIRRELARTHRLVWDYNFVWERWDRI